MLKILLVDDQSRAATELGMSRPALYGRMERLGLDIERRTKAS